MKLLKTALVGIGKVTDLHAKALKDLPLSEFTAVCSRSLDKARDYGSQYGVTGYNDVAEMVSKEKIDVLLICTPHPAHRDPAIAAMEAGAHVLIEKPLASSLEDCDAMLEAAKKYNKHIGVICQRRWNPPCQRIRQAIDEGKIGSTALGTIYMLGWRDQKYYESDSWRGKWQEEGGGVLVNQAPHQLDLLQWYMGEIDELYGLWSNLNHPYIEVEDSALAVIRFKNGGIGNILVSNSQKPGIYTKVHVHGSNGASVGVQTDGGAMFIAGMTSIQEPPVNDIWTVPGEEDNLEKWMLEDTDLFSKIQPTEYFHRLQIAEFLEDVDAGRPHLVSGEEGRKTVELFTGIYRSQRDKKPVKFPLQPEKGNDFDGRLA
jgi:predicted dehydrogenase